MRDNPVVVVVSGCCSGPENHGDVSRLLHGQLSRTNAMAGVARSSGGLSPAKLHGRLSGTNAMAGVPSNSGGLSPAKLGESARREEISERGCPHIGLAFAVRRAGTKPSEEIACSKSGSSSATVLTAPGNRLAFLRQSFDECPVPLQVQHGRSSLATSGCGHLVSTCVPPQLGHMRGPRSALGRLLPVPLPPPPPPLPPPLLGPTLPHRA